MRFAGPGEPGACDPDLWHVDGRGGQAKDITSVDVDPWSAWEEISLVDPTSLTEANRRLFAFGWLRAELNNGGFDQLFFNSAGDVVLDAIAAARIAGVTTLATLVERAIEPLGSPYPRDRTIRQDRLATLGDRWLHESARLDDYYELEATVDLDAAMRYLASHP